MAGEKTLDIGIGAGGTYITQDARHKILRIGLDLNPISLEIARQKYALPLVNADAAVNKTIHLPFKNKSFSKVEIILPHDELLIALTDQNSDFWQEIKRITKKEVSIILDTDYFGRQGVSTNGKSIVLDHPDKLIADNLRANGFSVSEFREMTSQEVKLLGTQFTKSTASWMQEMVRQKVYKIVASIK